MQWRLLLLVLLIVVAGAAPWSDDEDIKLLRKADVDPEGPSLVRYLRRRIVTPDDRVTIDRLVHQLGDESYSVRERATEQLAARGVPAITPLRRAASDGDVEVARRAERCLQKIEKVPSALVAAAAVRLIAQRKPEGAADVLLAFLPDADDGTVIDAIAEALPAVVMRDGQPDPAALRALDDKLPLIRAAAGEAFVRAGYRDAGRLMKDSDAGVRMRVTHSVVAHARDKSAVPALIELLADLPPTEAWRVEDVLQRLAGDAAPTVALGTDAPSRSACRNAWNEWWQKNGDGVDLARLDLAPALKGLTLVVQVDARPANGRVYEVNAAGEVTWKIENLQMPVDAVMVGHDRVLIAEYTGQRVSLYETNRAKVWSKEGVSMPQTLQALPKGHVLVTTRTQIIEWDDKQNEVFSYSRERNELLAALKDRNGDIVMLTTPGVCIRIDANKKELAKFSVGPRSSLGGLCLLPSGNLLTTHTGGVSEFDAKGTKLPFTVAVTGVPSSVQRLPNGNTLVALIAEKRLIEFDRDGKEVGEYRPPDNGMPRRGYRR